MFSWTAFCHVAISLIDDPRSRQDAELFAMLTAPTTPPRRVDEIGRLFPSTATINRHPDPSNLRRVLQIRCDSARDEGYDAYVSYAVKYMHFMDSVGPFSESNPLYFVSLCTQTGFYEFLYAPVTARAAFASTEHLAGNPRASTGDK